MSSSNFQIGAVSLKPAVVDRDFLKATRDAVNESKVRKGKKHAVETLDQWRKSGEVSPEDFQAFQDYTASVGAYYRQLQKSWWTARKEKNEKGQQALHEKMSVEGQILTAGNTLTAQLREAGARAAVQALAGTTSGPAGVLAAYAAYTNSMNWSPAETEKTKSVLEQMNALTSGKSEMITRNNEARPVHHKEIWKTMNQMLDKAIDGAKSGNPMEVDLQYYELTSHDMVKKVADAAKAGNKVRLNLDAGRLNFPAKDSEGDTYFNLDATPDKIRTIIQLASVPDADIAVSLFPQKTLLGSPTELMHRKVLRVGDEVLVGGMNANLGSGENIDSSYLLKGDSAARLADNVARDIQDSKGATLEDIWGQAHIRKFSDTQLKLGPRGFIALLDCLRGPAPAGTEAPDINTYEELDALAKEAGVKLSSLVESQPDGLEAAFTRMMGGRGHLTLSKKGKELLESQIDRAIELTNKPENIKKLEDMKSPESKVKAELRVDVADKPDEREALILTAISDAEKYIHIPAFVLTRSVAAALVARRDQVAAEGGKLDVKVILDASIYPHGGTPNSYGVEFLEDHGIQPRWSKLERSGDHDRKIHAKHMMTEKGEITGSTNFSTKGLRENWETSVYVHYSDDQASKDAQKTSSDQFAALWDSAYELNSTDYATLINRDTPGENSPYIVDQTRDSAIKQVLYMLGNYERETGKFHQTLLHENTAVRGKFEALLTEGYSYGDSLLQAVDEVLGADEHKRLLSGLSTEHTLRELAENVRAYKNGEEPAVQEIVLEDIPEELETFFA